MQFFQVKTNVLRQKKKINTVNAKRNNERDTNNLKRKDTQLKE